MSNKEIDIGFGIKIKKCKKKSVGGDLFEDYLIINELEKRGSKDDLFKRKTKKT